MQATLRYCKNCKFLIVNCYFGYFGYAKNTIVSACKKLRRLSLSKKIKFIPHLFLEILLRHSKLFISSTLGMANHPYQNQQYQLVGNWCLSASKKSTWFLILFLSYYILKNPAIWLAKSILAHNLRTRILPDKGFVVKYKYHFLAHSAQFWVKTEFSSNSFSTKFVKFWQSIVVANVFKNKCACMDALTEKHKFTRHFQPKFGA